MSCEPYVCPGCRGVLVWLLDEDWNHIIHCIVRLAMWHSLRFTKFEVVIALR